MLASLTYTCEFPTTGRTFKNRLVFAPGLTAIVGRNEAGKSLVLEFIRFALFGKAALRGLSSDYRNLSVQLELVVKNEKWSIDRSGSGGEFLVNGTVVAVGHDAMNKEVPRRLGFGLDVFDIACCANQDELLALTQMKPTARRQMVDSLIGMDLLEEIEKLCKTEAKNQQTVAQTLLISMPTPIEPEKPVGYLGSSELEQRVRTIEAAQRERERLLLVQEPVQPVEPEKPDLPLTLDEYVEQQEERNEKLQLQARLEGQLAMIPEPTVTLEEVEKAEAWSAYTTEALSRGPKPDYDEETLTSWMHVWHDKASLDEVIECPKCTHEFVRDYCTIDVAEVRAMPDPPLTMAEITTQLTRVDRWSEPLEEVPEYAYDFDCIRERAAHGRASDRRAIAERLASLRVPPDCSGEIASLRDYRERHAVWVERNRTYADQHDAYQSARHALESLPDRSGELRNLAAALADARQYERALAAYHDAAARHAGLVARAAEVNELGDGFLAGSAALKAARARVKAELAPSLSKAASTLVRGMTNGERQSIEVDGDFNIFVDGQPVNTLSGSGKAVVNLALRIGLGRVLTSGVLPLFLGDEIDAAMDADRTDATQQTMQSLKNHLGQVVLVTHKSIEADTIVSI